MVLNIYWHKTVNNSYFHGKTRKSTAHVIRREMNLCEYCISSC